MMWGRELDNVGVSSETSIREAATQFARTHLGPWTPDSTLVEQKENADGKVRLAWQNVRPSGARTGDWWDVTVSKRTASVIAFSQRRAPRVVSEDSVRVSREEAVAFADKRAGVGRTPQTTVTLDSAMLNLSSLLAPDYGPLWTVTYWVETPETKFRTSVLVDAITGEMIIRKRGGDADR